MPAPENDTEKLHRLLTEASFWLTQYGAPSGARHVAQRLDEWAETLPSYDLPDVHPNAELFAAGDDCTPLREATRAETEESMASERYDHGDGWVEGGEIDVLIETRCYVVVYDTRDGD